MPDGKITSADLGSPDWIRELANLLATVGQDDFDKQLFSLLSKHLSVDHCAVFTYSEKNGPGHLFTMSKMRGSAAQSLAQDYIADFFERDPQFDKIHGADIQSQDSSISAIRPDFEHDYDFDYLRHFFHEPNLVDKLYTIAEAGDSKVYCNFYRMGHSGPYFEADKEVLVALLPIITNVINNHFKVIRAKGKKLGTPGANVAQNMVHAVISQHVPPFDRLTTREAEICERILVGYTSLGISLDLGIAASSVNTYRRRAYEKLNISTQNELFSLCLEALGNTEST